MKFFEACYHVEQIVRLKMLSLNQESRWVRTPLSCPGTSQFLVLALRTYTWTGYSPAGSQVDTYLVIFLGHAYFSFFSVFKSVHTRKRNVGIVFARNLSSSSPSTRKRWQSGVMRPKISTIGTVFRNLLFWYSKSPFTCGQKKRRKKIFLFKNIPEPF